MHRFRRRLISVRARESGQTTSEYSIVIAVITIACITAIAALSAASTHSIARVAGYFT